MGCLIVWAQVVSVCAHANRIKKMAKKYNKAFTLVELLVVMGVIGLLMGILLPSLSVAREQGRCVVCKSNLKNIGLALLAYTNDSDDWLPAAEPRDKDDLASQQNWYLNSDLMASMGVSPQRDSDGNTVGPLAGRTILVCPSHRKPSMTREVLSDYPQKERPCALSYMMNGTWRLSNRGGNSGGYRRLLEFRKPSETLALCDGNGYERARGIVFYEACPKHNFEYRHKDTINTLFLDLHIDSLKEEDVPMGRSNRYSLFWSEKKK